MTEAYIILSIILLIVFGIPGIFWWKKDGLEIIKNKIKMKKVIKNIESDKYKDPFSISDDELFN